MNEIEQKVSSLINSTHPHKFKIISENNEMVDYLNNKFPMLNFKDNPREMGYLIKHGQTEPDKCQNPKCNKYLKFTEKKVMYRKIVCDNSCMHEKHRELGAYDEINRKRTQTSLKNYGTTHPMKNDSVKKKLEETFMNNYGETHPLKNKKIKEKASNTLFERTGYKHPSQLPDFKKKTEATNLERHGYEWVTKNPKVIAAREKTCLEKYGVKSIANVEDVKTKKAMTNTERYGGIAPTSSSDVIATRDKNNLEKYGRVCYNQRHIDDEIMRILNCPDTLQDMLTKYGAKGLVREFGVNDCVIYDRVSSYGLTLPPYHRSSYELHLANFLDEKGINYIHGDRTILKPRELDFYFPDKNLAVEICGLYWHSERQGKDKKYHYSKWKECKNKGIQLLTIFEDEIVNRRDFWYNKILNELHLTENIKIPARKCSVQFIDNSLAYSFIEDNHLQGKGQVRYSIGLFFGEELISVMTFANPRDNKKSTIDLNRFCNKIGYSVQGGASKMLKFFITNKPSDISTIISFSDNRYSSGKIYDTLGFSMEKELSPDYSYIINTLQRVHKASFRKNAIQVKFDLTEEYVSSKTERELMEEMGIERIWDCGKVKWSLSV